MHTTFSKILLALFFLFSLHLNAQTMYIKGRHLFTSEGEKVVLRGVNEMFIWSKDRTREFILPELQNPGPILYAWYGLQWEIATNLLETNTVLKIHLYARIH